jgi:ribosomal protein L40E
MICRNCGTRNPSNSKFCNNCGASLRPTTSLICPSCGASNPNHLLYCDQCGTRLPGHDPLDEDREQDPEELDESPKTPPTPFALPSRPAGKTANLNISEGVPDWLKTGDKAEEPGEDDTGKHRPGDDLPTWLLGEEMEQSFFKDPRTTDELFASADKRESEEDQAVEHELPEWLRGLAPEGTGPLPLSEGKSPDEQDRQTADDWLARLEEQETPEEDEWPPEWQGGAEDVDEWLAALETAGPEDAAEAQVGESSSTEIASEDRGTAGWPAGLDSEPDKVPEEPPDEEKTIPSAAAEEWGDVHDEEGVPAWLSEIPPEPPAPPASQAGSDETIPDWLSHLDEEEPEAGRVDEAELSTVDGIPDWLSDLESDDTGEPLAVEPLPGDEPDEGIPDWLGMLEESEDDAGAAPDDEIEPDAEWLDSFTFEGELGEDAGMLDVLGASSRDEPEEALPQADLPGGLDEAERPTVEEPGEAEPAPDWLDEAGTGPPAPEETAAVEAAGEPDEVYDWLPEGEETPDWLLAVAPEDEEPETVDEEEVPDWLTELDAAIGELEAASEESAEEWFDDLEGTEPAAEREDIEEAWASAERAAAEASEQRPDEAEDWSEKELLPAWLAPTELSAQAEQLEFEDEEPAEEPAASAEFETEGEEVDSGELPDWLHELEDSDIAESEPLDEAKLPEWLRHEPAPDVTRDEEAGLFAAPLPEEDEPEALEYAMPEEPLAEAESGLGAGAAEDELEMDEILGDLEGDEIVPADELPDWLEDVVAGDDFPIEMAPSDMDTVPEVLASRDLPGWLEDSLPDEEVAEPTPMEELPSWLKRPPVAEEEAPPADLVVEAGSEWTEILGELATPEETGDELSTADIPEWLQALRPGAPEREAGEARPEAVPVTEGPLAGLRGVVTVEPVVATTRAAEYPGRYQASKEQQQQAALLRQLTRIEPHEGTRVVAQPRATSSPWLRLVLSLLLLAAVLAGLFLPDLVEIAPSPVYPVAPVSEVLSAAAGEPVLVLFDYTPAFGGVLNQHANLFLQTLAAQDSQVIYASQSAAGLGLATFAVDQVETLQATRLGYIPGETIGLRRLAGCLVAAEGEAACAGYPAGTAGVAAIVLITSERDSLVDWIEQVDTVADVPLVAGVTRALLPVAAPYYASGQIDGLLAGEPAAAAYAATIGAESNGSQMALAFATWLVVVLLLAGNIVFLFSGLASSRRARRS